MSSEIFCDESKKKGLLLAASLISCNDIGRLKARVSSLLLPGQVRIHFCKEQELRRLHILDQLVAEGGIRTMVFDATRYDNMNAGRVRAMEAMAVHAAAVKASRIVIESDDSAVESDRKAIRRQLKMADMEDRVGVNHVRAREAPLLSVPDIVAWCVTEGGLWKQRAEPLIRDIEILLARVRGV